jgi:hypothetical protein
MSSGTYKREVSRSRHNPFWSTVGLAVLIAATCTIVAGVFVVTAEGLFDIFDVAEDRAVLLEPTAQETVHLPEYLSLCEGCYLTSWSMCDGDIYMGVGVARPWHFNEQGVVGQP